MQFIDLKAQYAQVKDKIQKRINDVLEHGQYIMGPEVGELEKQLQEFSGAKHALLAASGTDALLLALMALEIGPGDEVITTPFTFFATAEVIAFLGAKPVFVDIDEESYNIDPRKIEAAITSKTKAIMPVSIFGQCPDIDAINAIATKHNLPVIEDAAQSFGGTYKGKRSCSMTTMAATSFFPAKPLGCYGDGGAFFTNDDKLVELVKAYRNHGQSERYLHHKVGINGRLDTIQAAILIEKLAIFGKELKQRDIVAQRYTDLLKDDVITPAIKSGCTSAWAQYTIQVKNREQFLANMQKQNVPTAVHYPMTMNMQPVFKYLEQPEGTFPIAERVSAHVLSLPMHPYLDEKTQDQVIAAVKKSL